MGENLLATKKFCQSQYRRIEKWDIFVETRLYCLKLLQDFETKV